MTLLLVRSEGVIDTFSFFLITSGATGFAAMTFFIALRSVASTPAAKDATPGSILASSRMARAPGDTRGAFGSTGETFAILRNSFAGSRPPANFSFKKVHDKETHNSIARTG